MVQDYQHINQQMIKNKCPLSLIADILDGVGKRKVFTKLDLRQGYNNIRIKEGNEWKAVFTTHIRAYEPTVMYFGLTNSSANYYRQFIKNFARIATLLHVLVRKEQKWKWEQKQEEAFGKLKEIFTMEPVLAIPDIDKEIKVKASASDYATGEVLSTKCEDRK